MANIVKVVKKHGSSMMFLRGTHWVYASSYISTQYKRVWHVSIIIWIEMSYYRTRHRILSVNLDSVESIIGDYVSVNVYSFTHLQKNSQVFFYEPFYSRGGKNMPIELCI